MITERRHDTPPGCCESVGMFDWNLHRPRRRRFVWSLHTNPATAELWCLTFNIRCTEAEQREVQNASFWVQDLKWLMVPIDQVGETPCESPSMSLCERDGEERASGSALDRVIKTLVKMGFGLPPHPLCLHIWMQHPGYMWLSTYHDDVLHSEGNHGTHWGTHHVAMETASVYKAAQCERWWRRWAIWT